MLILYKPKQEHIKIVPLIPVSPAAKNVKLTRNQVQLLPGTNEITDDEWIVIKDHLKREIDSGVIVVVEKSVSSAKVPDGKAKNLKDMPTKEAIELVEGCNNPETLTKWYLEESRDEVRVLVVEKMRELKVDIPKRPSSSGDDKPKTIEEMSKDELVAYAAEKKITITATGTAEAILAEIKKAEAK